MICAVVTSIGKVSSTGPRRPDSAVAIARRARWGSMLGRATFRVPVASGLLGHRLYVRVAAQTPRSQTHVTASTVLLACTCG